MLDLVLLNRDKKSLRIDRTILRPSNLRCRRNPSHRGQAPYTGALLGFRRAVRSRGSGSRSAEKMEKLKEILSFAIRPELPLIENA